MSPEFQSNLEFEGELVLQDQAANTIGLSAACSTTRKAKKAGSRRMRSRFAISSSN